MVKKTCCVKGCTQNSDVEGTEFHKFPQTNSLKKKWLSSFQPSRKVGLSSLVCSSHFTEKDYKVVKGRRRLKIMAVPTVFSENPPNEDDDDDVPLKVAEAPFIEVRMREITTKEPYIMDDTPMDFEETIPEAKITKKYPDLPMRTSTEELNKDLDVNGDKISSEKESQQNGQNENIENTLKETDGQTKAHHTNTAPEDTNSKKDNINVKDIDKEAFENNEYFDDFSTNMEFNNVPNMIEIAVQNSRGEAGEADDCMMVLENVQVDIDPEMLMLEPPETVDLDQYESGEERPPAEPVSLLTSSDESDVILEEPHIDTVEVSDETSEDDRPLTRLLPEIKINIKKDQQLRNILWGKVDELACYSCPYTTTSRQQMKIHKDSHIYDTAKQIHVCTHCVYSTPSKYQFERHKKTHRADKKYSCNQCSYKARHQMSLAYHMKTHSDENFGCNECDFKTASVKSMQAHLSKHKQVRVKNGKKKVTRLKRKKSTDSSDEEYVPDEMREKKGRRKR